MNKENKTVSVALGSLDTPNSNEQIYNMDKTILIKRMKGWISENADSPIKIGIRALVLPGDGEGVIRNVDQLVCFDVING